MEIYTHVSSTNLYLGTCTTCDRPYRVDLANEARSQMQRFSCPGCGGQMTGERLAAVFTEEVCDSRCMGAAGPSCSCACGGENHGAAWGKTATTYELESAVKALRARQERLERQRQQRAEEKANRKQRIFDNWLADGNQDISDWLSNINGDYFGSFLCDMADRVGTQQPLSERQAEVVRRIMDEQTAQTAKQAAYEATKKTAPLGKGVIIEGTIISIKGEQDRYSYYDKIVWKMTVECDGYRVWGSVPSSLVDPVFERYETLRGQQVRFVAELVASKGGNESFAIFKRPTKAEKI